MKAIRVNSFGGPRVLVLDEVALPIPQGTQVRIKLESIGINYIDIYHRTGLYPGDLPFTPGVEGAGFVDAVGPQCRIYKPGDRVAYCMVRGSYSEFAIVEEDRLVSVPDEISFEQAASLMLQGLTAHYLSSSTYPLASGDIALVHAGAGGVGLLLIQMAVIAGATVIATVSTRDKADLATEAGAQHVVIYSEEDFESAVKAITKHEGVNVAYDSVGATTFERSLRCLKPRGLLVLFGQSSGPVPPMDLQLLSKQGSVFLTRPSLAHYVADRPELLSRAEAVFSLVSSGKVKINISDRFPLSEASRAHTLLEERKTVGKLLLYPGFD